MKNVYIYLILFSLLSVSTAFAQAVPTAPVTGPPLSLSLFETMIRDVAIFLSIVSGIIVFILIIYNGIRWMMAGDDTSKVSSAKEGLKATIIGALIIFGVGMIISTILKIMTTGSLY